MSDFDPNNPEHIERLRSAPEFMDALTNLKPAFEKLANGGLYPVVDEDGEFQITSDAGMTEETMELTRYYAPLIDPLLKMKEEPIRHQMLIEATKLFQRGEL
jgi:hypothetical protein